MNNEPPVQNSKESVKLKAPAYSRDVSEILVGGLFKKGKVKMEQTEIDQLKQIIKKKQEEGIIVLSLFDGMSCGRLALERAGIKVKLYIAAEIDPHAIAVTKYNWPETVHVGDVRNVTPELVRQILRENGIDENTEVDLLLAGSPCTDLSLVGKQKGLQCSSLGEYLRLKTEGHEFEGQSFLFWEFLRCRLELKPIYTFLENTPMKKANQDLITENMGVEPILINSSLLSAQNRKRLYWIDIAGIQQPDDKGILLKDVILLRLPADGSYTYQPSEGNGICKMIGKAEVNGHDIIKRVYSPDAKCPTLTAICGGNQHAKIAISNSEWRKLIPLEYERNQTIPDNYTQYGLYSKKKGEGFEVKELAPTNRYKMCGNGWTCDVIVHCFKNLPFCKNFDLDAFLLDLKETA